MQTSEQVTQLGTLTSSTTYSYDLQARMAVADVETFDATTGNPVRHEQTSYEYNPSGIRVSALREIDADLDGQYDSPGDSAAKTEYLIDDQNHTGYHQVFQETVTDPATGEIQKRVVHTLTLTWGQIWTGLSSYLKSCESQKGQLSSPLPNRFGKCNANSE